MKDWEVKYTTDRILDDKYYINTVHLRKINKELHIYGKITYNYVNNICQNYKNAKTSR